MEDNNSENQQAVKDAANEVKNETVDTFNQVKDTVKNTDFKEEARNSKGFLIEFISNPIGLLSSVANGLRNVLGTAIFFMIVAIVLNAAGTIVAILKSGFGGKLMMFVRDVTVPLIAILVPSIVVLLLNKNNKKPLPIIVQVLVLAYVPTIINSAFSLVTLIVSNSILTTIVSHIGVAITYIGVLLKYFGMKELFGEEDHAKFFKTFFIIILISQACTFVLGLINIV